MLGAITIRIEMGSEFGEAEMLENAVAAVI